MTRSWLLFVLVAAVGCDASTTGTTTAQIAVPDKPAAPAAKPEAPQVRLVPKSFEEIQQLIASKKGKVAVVDVWSTYCEPCMAEFPGLVALHKEYGPEKIACISICSNYAGLGKVEKELDEPLKFLQSQQATFDNVMSATPDNDLYEKLNLASRSVPAILVYDRDGKLVKTFDGEPKYAEVAKLVATLME